jgi:Holliday junction resolvase RusA-like endonuclease
MDKNQINAEIEIKPLSVNQVWQGRRYKTEEYDEYIKDCLRLLPKRPIIKGFISVNLSFYLKNANRCDLDNLIKPLLDILKKRGYFQDDRYIQKIEAQKVKSDKNRISIQIYALH